jgi:hypothetical protein
MNPKGMANKPEQNLSSESGAHLQQWAGSRDKNLLVLRSRPRFFLDISFYRTSLRGFECNGDISPVKP